MKLFKNIKPCYAVLLGTAVLVSSCKKLLVESPRSNVVPSAFATPQGLLAGIAGVYNDLRSAWGTEGFTINQMSGTDEYLSGGSASTSALHGFTYNGLTGSDFSGGFGFYSSINALNGILQLGPTTA